MVPANPPAPDSIRQKLNAREEALRDSTGRGSGLSLSAVGKTSAVLRFLHLMPEGRLFLPARHLPPVRSRSSISLPGEVRQASFLKGLSLSTPDEAGKEHLVRRAETPRVLVERLDKGGEIIAHG